jgi:hypothetical protein
MKRIQELIGNEATERLKERYGELVDCIGVEKEGPQIRKILFQLLDWKIDQEGLQDRWVKIIEMKISKHLSKYPEPGVDCVKEGLWVW